MSKITTIVDSIISKVNNCAKLNGDQTIAGVKTFSSSPIVPTPTTGTQAVNKDYVDNKTWNNLSYKNTPVTITSWSYATTTITLNVASHTFVDGDSIEVYGLLCTTNIPNGIYTVIAQDATHIVFTAGATPTGTATVSSATVKGYVTINGRVSESIGVNQTWQNVLSSRASGVTYTNTSGKPKMIAIGWTNNATAGNLSPDLVIGGLNIYTASYDNTTYAAGTVTAIVPNNTTYVFTIKSTQTIVKWAELG